ncbi:MAG: helix-turn-helix domain-containing protein [Verrucomicrobiae bacterium]|nr:helix-turn-helix domain-containing protein [Verrucomicrobiae bacterium]
MRAAREAKGMSIEDVAFATRIHASHIRSLEADDYSGFASTTYAKSFLSLYSRFLSVDAAEALHYFAGTDDIRLGGNTFLPTVQPIQSVAAPRNRAPERSQRSTTHVQRESPGLAPLLMGFVVLLLLAGIPALWFLGKDAESIDDVTSKAKEIADVTRTEIASVGGKAATTETASNDAPEVQAVVAATDFPEPTENPDATPEPKPSTNEKSRQPRSVAADWVLENSNELPNAKPKAEPLGGNSGESTLDTKPVNEPVNDPGPSTAVAVAIPTTPSLESEISPSLSATPVSDLPHAFDAASQKPTPDATETEEVGDAPPPAMPLEKKPDNSTPKPASKPASLRAEPSAPTSDTPPAQPIVAAPLRAVPFVAKPIEEEPESAEETTEDTETEADRDRPAFVDPRNRFPRPLE